MIRSCTTKHDNAVWIVGVAYIVAESGSFLGTVGVFVVIGGHSGWISVSL